MYIVNFYYTFDLRTYIILNIRIQIRFGNRITNKEQFFF